MKTFQTTLALRIIRDDSVIGSFSADFRAPDLLQQAWQCIETGEIEWRNVGVILKSKLVDAKDKE